MVNEGLQMFIILLYFVFVFLYSTKASLYFVYQTYVISIIMTKYQF